MCAFILNSLNASNDTQPLYTTIDRSLFITFDCFSTNGCDQMVSRSTVNEWRIYVILLISVYYMAATFYEFGRLYRVNNAWRPFKPQQSYKSDRFNTPKSNWLRRYRGLPVRPYGISKNNNKKTKKQLWFFLLVYQTRSVLKMDDRQPQSCRGTAEALNFGIDQILKNDNESGKYDSSTVHIIDCNQYSTTFDSYNDTLVTKGKLSLIFVWRSIYVH